MMTRNEYLRRALLAPILVPLLAAIPFFKNVLRSDTLDIYGHPSETGFEIFSSGLVVFLLCSLVIGGVPYLWMIQDKRKEFRDQKRLSSRWQTWDWHPTRKQGLRYASDDELSRLWQNLPMEMMPYFYKFWVVLTVCLIPTMSGVLIGFGALLVGTVAVPILGYLYVAVTFGSLSLFRWIGWVE